MISWLFLSRFLYLIFQEFFKTLNFNTLKNQNKINIKISVNLKIIYLTILITIFGGVISQIKNLQIIGYGLFFLGIHFLIHFFHKFIDFKTGIVLLLIQKLIETVNFINIINK